MLNKFTLEKIDDILGDNQDSPHKCACCGSPLTENWIYDREQDIITSEYQCYDCTNIYTIKSHIISAKKYDYNYSEEEYEDTPTYEYDTYCDKLDEDLRLLKHGSFFKKYIHKNDIIYYIVQGRDNHFDYVKFVIEAKIDEIMEREYDYI